MSRRRNSVFQLWPAAILFACCGLLLPAAGRSGGSADKTAAPLSLQPSELAVVSDAGLQGAKSVAHAHTPHVGHALPRTASAPLLPATQAAAPVFAASSFALLQASPAAGTGRLSSSSRAPPTA